MPCIDWYEVHIVPFHKFIRQASNPVKTPTRNLTPIGDLPKIDHKKLPDDLKNYTPGCHQVMSHMS